MRAPGALQGNAHTGTIAQIRQMAAIVKEHKSIDGLNLWSVKAWD
jgi:hypothetical protein